MTRLVLMSKSSLAAFAARSRRVTATCSFFGTTVDSSEVDKFEQIGASWWSSSRQSSENGPAGVEILRDMNFTRVDFVRQEFYRTKSHPQMKDSIDENQYRYNPFRGLNILDVGCGGGILSESLARLGANVTAIDPSGMNIAVARRHSRSSGDGRTSAISYYHGSIESYCQEHGPQSTPSFTKNATNPHSSPQQQLEQQQKHQHQYPLYPSQFDAVLSMEVIEHIEETHRPSFLAHAQQLVRPDGGLLVLSTISRTPASYLIGILGAEYITGLVPPGTHEWSKFVTPGELQRLVEVDGPGYKFQGGKNGSSTGADDKGYGGVGETGGEGEGEGEGDGEEGAKVSPAFKVRSIKGLVFNPFRGRCSTLQKRSNNNHDGRSMNKGEKKENGDDDEDEDGEWVVRDLASPSGWYLSDSDLNVNYILSAQRVS